MDALLLAQCIFAWFAAYDCLLVPAHRLSHPFECALGVVLQPLMLTAWARTVSLDPGMLPGGETKAATKTMMATGSGIKVMKFGPDVPLGNAGEDHGSAPRAATCGRRTVLGGMFTS